MNTKAHIEARLARMRVVMHTITQKAGGLIQIGPLLPDVMLSEVGVSHE